MNLEIRLRLKLLVSEQTLLVSGTGAVWGTQLSDTFQPSPGCAVGGYELVSPGYLHERWK